MNENMAVELKNILIIKPSSLGDIVLALPALTALRKSFPDARISWLVRPEYAPILENHPHLSEIICFDRNLFAQCWHSPAAFRALVGFIKYLRGNQFDAVFDFQGLFRTGLFARLTGCSSRFGMAGARELAHIFYTHKIPQDKTCIHLVDYFLKMVGAAGVSDTSVEFILPQSYQAADSVKQLLTEHKAECDNYAVFIPGAARENKRWPIERFGRLADEIASQFALSVVAVGSSAEGGYVEGLRRDSNVPIANLAGKTNLGGLVELLRGTRVVVSNDTGPGHIAAALGVPMVMIFGPTNPARVHPYSRPECAVAVEPNSRGMNADSYDPRHDIRHITVEQVLAKVCEQMGKRHG
jgi:lipopolysaccharide heptosyltransferase I